MHPLPFLPQRLDRNIPGRLVLCKSHCLDMTPSAPERASHNPQVGSPCILRGDHNLSLVRSSIVPGHWCIARIIALLADGWVSHSCQTHVTGSESGSTIPCASAFFPLPSYRRCPRIGHMLLPTDRVRMCNWKQGYSGRLCNDSPLHHGSWAR